MYSRRRRRFLMVLVGRKEERKGRKGVRIIKSEKITAAVGNVSNNDDDSTMTRRDSLSKTFDTLNQSAV